jgi:hypothetical protein
MNLFKNQIVSVLGAALVISGALAWSPTARAEHTRVTYPNAISLEVFGRGLLYGLSYDRVLSDDLVVGLSYGHTPLDDLNGNDANVGTSLIPVYLNYYFSRSAGSLFMTAGVTVVTSTDEAKDHKTGYGGVEFGSSRPVLPTFGVGFEERSDANFLFRVTGYGIVGRKLAPWFGISLGYAF